MVVSSGNVFKIVRKRLSSIKPSPENLRLYRPIDENDTEIIALAESIKANGLREPLVVTADGYIVSGHRRYAALKRIKQVVVPCHVLEFRRLAMSEDEYLGLLREYNRQRTKSAAEQVREAIIDLKPEEAHKNLIKYRERSVWRHKYNEVPVLKIEGTKTRCAISDQKADHVKYVKKVVFEDRREYWPLSVRSVHYPLLNYSFFRNIPRRIKYQNDDGSYDATSDLITRMRLNGTLPWEAFDDVTRPFHEFRPFSDAREFVRQERDNMFSGYWRDLLQTQPNHIEVLCEKNTIYHMVLKVTKKFLIPTSSGRGFNSIDPWKDLYDRYTASGKRRLIVIVLSDFDPEGEMIPQVGGRTLRDDFGVRDVDIIKAGVTRKQIIDNELPKQNFAKEDSKLRGWFLERNNGDDSVYELEALDPAVMLADLETILTSVLDMNLFSIEESMEQDESTYLEAVRNTAHDALRGLV